MAKALPSHIEGLSAYLSQNSERNEDLALTYFRNVYGDSFKRQSDDETFGADGYVPGHFVLELKGNKNDWYSALFQGLAYKNKGLSFSLVIVAAKDFLAVWSVSDIPTEILSEIAQDKSAPSSIGKKISKKYQTKKNQILNKAEWFRPEIFDPLFANKPHLFLEAIKSFENTVKERKKVRQAINTKNFVKLLENMKQFFDPKQPIKTVRAFYSMIYGPWDETSILHVNQRYEDRATIGGVEITNLIPAKRNKFKEFVENHNIQLSDEENIDDFFARYDAALDAVDKEFRVKNGIFFTDLDLSKFVMWIVKQQIPNLGKNYLVVDPACGSGNLVTNWRSPLELRHKVVSEIEPELLYAVEQRMKGDQWHNGKFTVVPKVTENKGLNFLDKSATEYVEILNDYLREKGQKPNKPLAFLCNPPYRSDDDQSAESISYTIHEDIINMVGPDAASERYCCFLAQMKLICKEAAENGIPEDSALLLFTQTSWLTNRPIFKKIRKEIFGSFQDVGSVIVNSKEFFDVKGSFPIAFTIWKYKGENSGLNENRPLNIIDLTWLKKSDLANIRWNDPEDVEVKCKDILKNDSSINVTFGANRDGIQEWTGEKMSDFKRGRRQNEFESKTASGLPKGDERHNNKKAYGEADGNYIGFMDDLGLCRIKKDPNNFPWFRLNSPFMDVRKTRCLSGPADQKSFKANDLESAKKMFFWYGLGRVFSSNGYPMWANQLELWPVDMESESGKLASEYSFALAYSENECIETTFPAKNPVKEAIEIYSTNPLSPLLTNSFWNSTMKKVVEDSRLKCVRQLVKDTDAVYSEWNDLVKKKKEISVDYEKPYFVGQGKLKQGAGLIQIRDYARALDNRSLLSLLEKMQDSLISLKNEYHKFVLSEKGLSYFTQNSSMVSEQVSQVVKIAPKTRFEIVLEKRKAIASLVINGLANDPNLGTTKLAKVMYMADRVCELDLEANYVKDVAGPVDGRMFYNPKIGIFPNQKSSEIGKIIESSFKSNGKVKKFKKIIPSDDTERLSKEGLIVFGSKSKEITNIIKIFKPLTTDHAEAVATLYACWNDLIISKKKFTESDIIKNFYKWSKEKVKFGEDDLYETIKWMKRKKLQPIGRGPKTAVKGSKNDDEIPF